MYPQGKRGAAVRRGVAGTPAPRDCRMPVAEPLATAAAAGHVRRAAGVERAVQPRVASASAVPVALVFLAHRHARRLRGARRHRVRGLRASRSASGTVGAGADPVRRRAQHAAARGARGRRGRPACWRRSAWSATAGLVARRRARCSGFAWPPALLLGAVVSSTDAAAVFSVLRTSGISLKRPRRLDARGGVGAQRPDGGASSRSRMTRAPAGARAAARLAPRCSTW